MTMTTRRHLRIWYVDADGKEIDRSPLSSVLLPMCKVPLSRRRAFEYTGAAHRERRMLAVDILCNEKKRAKPLFRGIVVLACPDRAVMVERGRQGRAPGSRMKLTPYTCYTGSCCAISTTGQLVVGELCEPTLKMAYRTAMALVREILTRKAEQASEGKTA
jgi:hypothetical protein